MKLADLKRELLAESDVAAEYDALKPEFDIVRALVESRRKARLSQAEVAERMGTTQSSVARMESGKGNVTLDSIRRYAKATGRIIKLEFAP